MNTESIKNILNESIPIGSRVWGGYTEKSDIDLVLSLQKSEKLEALLIKDLNAEIQIVHTQYDDDRNLQSEYNYKVTYRNQPINIIVVPENRIEIIKQASMLMAHILVMDKTPQVRDERIRRFGLCINIFEGPAPETNWEL